MTDSKTSDLLGGSIIKAATISPCGQYRYRLTRHWDGNKQALPFVMLNPSTADAEIDDPTIRRCMGFARRADAGGIIVVNLFAFRATKPAALKRTPDPIGPNNADHLQEIAIVSDKTRIPVVCAWGAGGGSRAADVVRMMIGENAYLVCLGTTQDGHPRHPLYVRGDQPFVTFTGMRRAA